MRAKYSFSMDVCTSCLSFARMHSAYLVGKLPCNFGILLACFYRTPCITLFTINLQNTFRMETDLYRINKKSLSLVDQIPSVLFINRYVQYCPIAFFICDISCKNLHIKLLLQHLLVSYDTYLS